MIILHNTTLPETNIAYENRSSQKGNSSSNHRFSRAILVSREGNPTTVSGLLVGSSPKKNNGWKKYAKHGTCINKRDIWSPAYKSWKQGNPLPHCCPVLWVEFVLWVEESAVKCMGHPTQTVALVEQIPN